MEKESAFNVTGARFWKFTRSKPASLFGGALPLTCRNGPSGRIRPRQRTPPHLRARVHPDALHGDVVLDVIAREPV